jgi:hypothetical protein
MTRFNPCAFILLALALLSVTRVVHAAESYDNCTGFITSLPAVINAQGTWCMKQDLATAISSGNAITIAANNVIIDCNDFKLGGLAAGISTGTLGIYSLNRSNVTVRHCNLRGFYYGVLLQGAGGSGHAVEDNRFDGNTFISVNVDGDGSVIRRNRVFDTGGSTWQTDAYGISAYFTVDILDNTVSGVVARSGGGGGAIGIYTNTSDSGNVIGNRVRGLVKDGTNFAVGIANVNDTRVEMRDNNVMGAGELGLSCGNSNDTAKDNVINGFGIALVSCSNVGGNAILP